MVNQACADALNPQAALSAGTMAEAENQTDMPMSSVKERRARAFGLVISSLAWNKAQSPSLLNPRGGDPVRQGGVIML